MGTRYAMHDGRRRARSRGYRRTKTTAAVSVAALGLAVLLAPSGVAEETRGSAPETGEIRNGTAKATAVVAKVAPGVGQLELGITFGSSVTQVKNDLAQATSQTGDLGLIGTSLTTEGCGGSSVLQAEQLPQPTAVDNREGDASAERDEFGTAGSPFGLGRMQVEASDEPPASRARASSGAVGSPGTLEVGGGTSEAITRVLPGEGREALATATSSLDLGGVIRMEGMRWFAHHRTGTDPLAEGTFEVGRAVAAGVPLPTDDLSALQEGINTALAQTGISIALPTVQRLVEPADLIRVTPMRVEMRDSPAGKAALGPALDITRAQRVELFNSIVAAACDLAGVLLVGDVAISVLAGTGFMTVDIGGVEATSSDFELGNPFGSFVPAVAGAATPATGAGPELPSPSAAVAGPATGASSPPSTVAGGPGSGQHALPTRRTSAVVEVCESLHPNGDECSHGAATLVGLLGLFGTLGVAGADVLRQRRRHSLEAM